MRSLTDLSPLAPFRDREGRLAIAITLGVWFISSILFVIPMAVAGQEMTLQMAWSIVAIALGGSLVSLILMVFVWRVFESEKRLKVPKAILAIMVAATVLTLIDLAAAKLFISIQPGSQLGSGLVFRATNNFAVFIPHFGLLGALYALLAHNRKATLQERLLADANSLAQQARLSALRYQLNPHFLFNTLNSISSLVVTGRNRDAEEMLARLSEFLRTTLAADPENTQTLEGELETVDAYLGIERIRFGDRLGFDLECPAELRDALMPQFLLQPLVENAIKYGVAPTEDMVTIAVDVRQESDRLAVTVRNDAPGHPPSSHGAGVGLRNVRDRLQALFGDLGTLETQSRGGKYTAVIRLPLVLG
ncbi:sensor histidine kinase [Erythrobacter alti]|uniref:sensor histidine kinase n=1 Tax=Erythrobacter alti TaxID=1896145 RepID=UPI0030F3F106